MCSKASEDPRFAGVLFVLLHSAIAFGVTAACRADADGVASSRPRIEGELEHTFDSPEGLGRAVLEALEAEDVDALRSYALDEEEFRRYIWPELPSARPERNLPFHYVWGDLHQKSTNCLRRLVAYAGGRRFELLGVEFDGETTSYETYEVHRDARLIVRDDAGKTRRVDFFGSMLERNGRYKLFSFVVD